MIGSMTSVVHEQGRWTHRHAPVLDWRNTKRSQVGMKRIFPCGNRVLQMETRISKIKSEHPPENSLWWEQEESEVVKTKLIQLQAESRLDSLTMPQLRGLMKHLNQSTRGTKQALLLSLSRFLHHESWAEVDSASAIVTDGTSSKRVAETKVESSRRVKSAKVVAKDAEIVAEAAEAWSVLVHKKSRARPEWVPYHPHSMRPIIPPATDCLKVISWNVNGLRALLKRKDEVASVLARLAETEKFDIICLQETKLQEKDVEAIKSSILEDYHSSFWSCSTSKLGYSGSAVISRTKPLSVTIGLGDPLHDGEGRVITTEFDSFFLVNVYVPNSGQKLERLAYRTNDWDPALSSHLMDLQKKKPVVLTGDLNCAHQEMDIYDPNGNTKSAGFTPEERKSFGACFLEKGFVDTFRRQHPNAVGYTYWSYRSNARRNNRGWRLDYFLVSEALHSRVLDSYTLPHVDGSDHCPVGLILSASY